MLGSHTSHSPSNHRHRRRRFDTAAVSSPPCGEIAASASAVHKAAAPSSADDQPPPETWRHILARAVRWSNWPWKLDRSRASTWWGSRAKHAARCSSWESSSSTLTSTSRSVAVSTPQVNLDSNIPTGPRPDCAMLQRNNQLATAHDCPTLYEVAPCMHKANALTVSGTIAAGSPTAGGGISANNRCTVSMSTCDRQEENTGWAAAHSDRSKPSCRADRPSTKPAKSTMPSDVRLH